MSTNITPMFENYLRIRLACHGYNDPPDPHSILEGPVRRTEDSVVVFEPGTTNRCPHDTGYLCKCRLQWLIDTLKDEFNTNPPTLP